MTSRTGNVRVAGPNDQITPGCLMDYNHTKIMRIKKIMRIPAAMVLKTSWACASDFACTCGISVVMKGSGVQFVQKPRMFTQKGTVCLEAVT